MEEETFTSQGMVADVRRGLLDHPKWLSSLYFYDEAGSKLFEKICETPEYYPTRTEQALLEAHANDILERAGDNIVLGELGSGSSSKTRVVLDALINRQGPSLYLPVDVSEDFLNNVAGKLEAEHPGLTVRPIAAEYSEGLAQLGRTEGDRRLVLFLGSSVGNFEPEEQVALLRRAYESLQPGDAFLLGTDMVKDPHILEAAYNDAAGMTASFNLNILTHIARELGGQIDLDGFQHMAVWNATTSCIEMHLKSVRDQRIVLSAADIDVAVAAGETIHTENSYKFTVERAQEVAKLAGWTLERTWTDEKSWFALHLLRR